MDVGEGLDHAIVRPSFSGLLDYYVSTNLKAFLHPYAISTGISCGLYECC